MEIIFIRHGHGEHLEDYPDRLHTLHPSLTELGKLQVSQLREQFEWTSDDMIVVSPTKRTIETAHILTNHTNFIISPLVGPRMFPLHPEFPTLMCDQIYSRDELAGLHHGIEILDFGLDCWREGINTMDQKLFETYALLLLSSCQERQKRLIIISHDGTITNYRMLLGEHGLTRGDFLGEAGVHKTKWFLDRDPKRDSV
ncbi:histidine phosphatase family protein [Paenibacillus solani]|uniref:Phosphoglycerate mutase n=1 Tax=Paenibacillus solani TaxID=1705565 RepID=A0A0M1P5E8_9BACL|nr:histidine phosphatase family protein [Paenibacillus solani]KOR89711.1 phosphoglycerate mutase [Paenibacillus solani]